MVLAWSLTGCDDDAQLGRVAPELVVTPPTLAFGEVPLAATRRLDVEIRNAGSAPLQVSGLDAAEPFLVDDAPLEILAGQSVRLAVGFRPTNDEAQQGSLRIMSNDPEQPSVTVALSGRGVQGDLTVRPTEIRLEGTKVGTTRAAELVLDNVGLDVVEGLLRTDDFAQPQHFTLSGLSTFAGGGRFSVPAQTQQVLELRYQPQLPGEHSGRIVFETCGERCGLEVDVLASADVSLVQLDPPVVDFGAVGIAETATELVRVLNRGDDPLQVLAVRTLGSADVSAAATRALPATVEPGDALGLNVEFRPTSALPAEAEIEVDVGPVQETLRGAIIGQGEGPRFEVDPTAINFGVERGPGTYRRPALLVNAGSSRVNVQSLEVVGDPAFALGALPTLPVGLGPGESLIVEVLFSPAAVAEYAGTLRIASDDPLEAQVDVPITGGLSDRICELDLAPSAINFGLLPPTYERTQEVTLTNVGADTCEVVGGAFRAPLEPALTIEAAPWPVTLASGATQTLRFRYAPTIETDSKATYVMQTSDPVFPERPVSLFGTSNGSLEVFTVPPNVDFGASRVECPPVSEQVALVNAGTIDVVVSSLVVSATTAEFTVAGPPTPFTLRAGATQPFGVAYDAADLGPDQGFVEITVDDFGFALSVPLEGVGATDPRMTDTFEQAANNVVDVLFVVDDSCSMGDDQRALAQNFRSFIQQADLRQVDFQIAVTTTTLRPFPGHIVGQTLMTPTTANLEGVFASTVNVGTNGSGIERGMQALSGVLQAADRGLSPHASWLRPNSARVVVFVGDEDDQSAASVAQYYQEIRQRAQNGFTVAAVTGQAGGCATADPAPRYEDLVRLSNGVSASICAAWSQTLARIGQVAFGLRSRFFLSRAADSGRPFVVTVDGVVQNQGVQYDGADNSVVFTTPPPEGAIIRVEYSTTCS